MLVSNPAKVGVDAGVLAGVADTGVLATDDIEAVLGAAPDAVAYGASGDFRPQEALADIERCLRVGANVVTPAVYDLLHPPSAPQPLRDRVHAACAAGNSSIFVTGIDPGWALDLLPLVLSGVAGRIDEIRAQEIFCYETYHAPDTVRYLIGFGQPMDEVPVMLDPNVLIGIWGGMIRVLQTGSGSWSTTSRPSSSASRWSRPSKCRAWARSRRARGRVPVRGARHHRRRATDRDGARDTHRGRHLARAAERTQRAPRMPPGHHQRTTLADGDDRGRRRHRNPAEGGNTTAAGRMVHAIPAVCAAGGAGDPLDLPLVIGRGLRP